MRKLFLYMAYHSYLLKQKQGTYENYHFNIFVYAIFYFLKLSNENGGEKLLFAQK